MSEEMFQPPDTSPQQAFPRNPYKDSFGMTLRDYLAAKAMQGILAYPGDGMNGSAHNNMTLEGCAELSYKYADAMLAEREKQS